MPGRGEWIIEGWGADPTSGSLRKTDVTSTSLREALRRGTLVVPGREGMDNRGLGGGPDKRVPPENGRDKHVPPRGASEGHACRARVRGMDNQGLGGGPDKRVPPIGSLRKRT